MVAAIFISMHELMLLNITRAHYIIDFVTGVILAFYTLRRGEWLAYWLEVKILGLPKWKRKLCYFKLCSKCGFCNHDASLLSQKTEVEF